MVSLRNPPFNPPFFFLAKSVEYGGKMVSKSKKKICEHTKVATEK